MTPAEIKARFANLNIWQRGDQRAPHKPLLVLYALGKLSRGEGPQIPYREVDEDLRRLLQEFRPDRKSYHPEYPAWRLQNADILAAVGLDLDAATTRRRSRDPAFRRRVLTAYLDWMLGADFPDETLAILRDAKEGSFPEPDTGTDSVAHGGHDRAEPTNGS